MTENNDKYSEECLCLIHNNNNETVGIIPLNVQSNVNKTIIMYIYF